MLLIPRKGGTYFARRYGGLLPTPSHLQPVCPNCKMTSGTALPGNVFAKHSSVYQLARCACTHESVAGHRMCIRACTQCTGRLLVAFPTALSTACLAAVLIPVAYTLCIRPCYLLQHQLHGRFRSWSVPCVGLLHILLPVFTSSNSLPQPCPTHTSVKQLVTGSVHPSGGIG